MGTTLYLLGTALQLFAFTKDCHPLMLGVGTTFYGLGVTLFILWRLSE